MAKLGMRIEELQTDTSLKTFVHESREVNSEDHMGAFLVPRTILHPFTVFTHLIFTKTLQIRYCYFPHFSDEETKF